MSEEPTALENLSAIAEMTAYVTKLQANRDHWRDAFLNAHKGLTLSLISHDWQTVKKVQMEMWKIRKDFESHKGSNE